MYGVHYPLQSLSLPIFPDPDVLGRNAAFLLQGCRLNDRKPRAALDDTAKVGKMPVGRIPVLARPLAEWCEEQSVLHGEATDLEWSEELWE